MHMTAIAYNLNIYVKFIVKNVKIDAKAMGHLFSSQKGLFRPQINALALLKFSFYI